MAAAVSICCSTSSICHSPAAPSPSPFRPSASSLSSSSAAVASSSSAPFFGLQSKSLGGHRRRDDERRFTFEVNAKVGEWGARDPFPGETESNFGEKVLGNEGTEHIILIPPSLLGLAERTCTPLEPGTAPLSEEEATALLRKVVGWRLAKTDSGLKIWTEWKLKDSGAGITLFDRIAAVAEAEGHYPELQLQGDNTARAELFTQSIGGLSMNDFIFAAKIDKIKTSDLVKKNRFWA
ncbi:unnamed protein product [Calypogeia fissa]